MGKYTQDHPDDPESGGVLLGRKILDSNDIVVDRVTEPFPSDHRRRRRFIRRSNGHQEAVNEAWQASGGTTIYLGEWHTHPEPVPTPSSIDITDWRKKAEEADGRGGMFFLILGIETVEIWETADPNQDPVHLV